MLPANERPVTLGGSVTHRRVFAMGKRVGHESNRGSTTPPLNTPALENDFASGSMGPESDQAGGLCHQLTSMSPPQHGITVQNIFATGDTIMDITVERLVFDDETAVNKISVDKRMLRIGIDNEFQVTCTPIQCGNTDAYPRAGTELTRRPD